MQTNQKIPEGWSVKKVKDLGRVVTGSTPSMSCPENYGGTFCWATAQDFSSKYISDTVIKLSEQGKNCSRILPSGSVLITCIASLGLNAISKVEMATNQQINAIIPNKENNGEFIYYQISYNTNQLKRFAGAGGMMILTKGEFEKVPFIFPPLAEQEKIADILGTWDEAIEKLSGLIEQKKLLKKGLMQKLLTGKTRLSTFTQPWKEVKLGEICKLETATSKSAFIDENGKYYIIDMGAVSTEGTLISSKRTNACEDLLKINDIVMPKDDIGGGNIIGKTAIIKQENTYVLSDHVFKLNIHDSDANFISYLINSYGYNKYMRRMSCGSAILGLSKKDVEKCLLYIPSDISEQQAIADVLSTADDEINLLNQKLEALKEQKKGLMQQLLTGQIRVKVN
ncbi:MAG: restriction endonuclease subunit S [Alphaproteobacteria bacterium]|nr:restriction endonuclease subunit S [Alphaproteobacteria bacterium]